MRRAGAALIAAVLLALVGACVRQYPAPPAGDVKAAEAAEASQPKPDAEDNWAEQRRRMVETQIQAKGIWDLRTSVTDKRVIQAMLKVPRHEFVPEPLRFLAYADRPVDIGEGQTISQPYIVAFMTEQLKLKPKNKVLEIGTGSGYQAAVLAEIVKQVYTIEIVEPLGKRAMETLERLEYKNVATKIGDGYRGWPKHAPFDAIIVTCAPERIPQPLKDQLKEGGRMIIPVGELWAQELYLLEKRKGEITRTAVLPVAFVPMTGEAQRKGEAP
ncbi:MAG: protein-L-isoaspartate(D-aspartate) O-methyltransferase [Armatimonadota bacterium]